MCVPKAVLCMSVRSRIQWHLEASGGGGSGPRAACDKPAKSSRADLLRILCVCSRVVVCLLCGMCRALCRVVVCVVWVACLMGGLGILESSNQPLKAFIVFGEGGVKY